MLLPCTTLACPCNGSLENLSAFECALVDLNSRSYWYAVSMIAHLWCREASVGNPFFESRIVNRGLWSVTRVNKGIDETSLRHRSEKELPSPSVHNLFQLVSMFWRRRLWVFQLHFKTHGIAQHPHHTQNRITIKFKGRSGS